MKKTIIYIIILILISFFIISYKQIKNPTTKTITFSSWGSKSETDVINLVIQDYEKKNPNIKVKFIHIPQNYFQKIHLLFASGLEPDVIFINNHYIEMYKEAGLLEDLTPNFSNANEIFFKEALQCFQSNNEIYAIPRDISNLVIYYNKEIFSEHKISNLEIRNIFELKKLAEKLTTNKYFGINSEENPIYWLYYLSSNGGGVISDTKKEIIINSPKSIEALQLYSDLVNKYHIAPSKAQIGSMTTAQMFINGKLAMYLGGRWMVPKFRDTIKFDWDIIEFPSTPENKVYIDASGWAVSKKSKNKKEAIELIKYLSSKETSDNFSKSGLIIPARKDSAHDIYFLDNKKPKNSKVFLDMLKNTKPTPTNEHYGSINDILNEKAQAVFYDNKSPEEAFDEKTIKKLKGLL